MTIARAAASPPSRRGRILQAALECFSEAGYASTTIDHVRQRAGASVGSMYHHFDGKEELAAALLVDGRRTYYQAWLNSLERRRTAEGGIRAAVQRHFDWMSQNLTLGRFIFGFEDQAVTAAATAPIRLVRSDFQSQLLEWLGPFVEQRRLQRLPDDVYEPLWMAPAQSFSRLWLGWDDHRELRRFHRHFSEGAWAALRRD